MNNRKIITISRQYGSGGREIGKKLAQRLNSPFYDYQLLEMAAKECHIDEDLFAENEEKMGGDDRYLSGLAQFLGKEVNGMFNLSIKDRMFIAQSNLIESLAQKESAVFVGRCADWILKNDPNCIHVFIHANETIRKQRVVRQYGVPEKDALDTMHKIDRKRKNYYEYYTDGKWGAADHFSIVIDSGRFGIDKIVDLLEMAICDSNKK